MSEGTSIFTDDDVEIPYMEWDAEHYLDKSTLLYGASNSGKTYIIRAILYLLRNLIPNVLLVAPENTQPQYDGLIPKCCMLEDLTKEKLESLWRRQCDLKQIWDIANNIDLLESIFTKGQDRQAIMLIYKKSIREHRESLLRNPYLSIKEKMAVMYIDINPRLLFIIDDSSECFIRWQAYFSKNKDDNIFDKLLTKGRHQLITTLIASHDDTYIKSNMRKNAANSIWTTNQSLNAYVLKPNAGFSPAERKMMIKIADRIFSPQIIGGKKIQTFQKMIYVRNLAPSYRYLIAGSHEDFKIGCSEIWELEKRLPKKEQGLEHNQFLPEQFKEKKKPIKKFKRD